MQQATFCNPVPFADGKPHTSPDPFVLRWCGAYYCYATDENGVLVSSSPDLVHWTAHGYALQQAGHRNFWAPAVLYHNGRFYLYYSHEPREILQLAISNDPLGPFVWQTQLSELFSIDAHPVLWRGERYLFYASDEWMGCEEERTGTSVLLDKLLPDGRPEGRPVPVLLPDNDSEIFARNRFGDGRSWHTLEGPCFLPGAEYSFLLYSANCYTSEDYYVHYAVAENKDDLRDMVWSKKEKTRTPFPLLKRSCTVEGTGHNTVVPAPDLVHRWMVYHGRPVGKNVFPGDEQRQMYIAPLWVNEQTLWMPTPTHEPQAVPQQPGYYCAKQHLALQQRWEICSLPQNVRIEAWFHPQSRHTGVKFSLYLAMQDEQNTLELVFSTGRRQMQLWERRHGLRRLAAQAALPPEFALYVPHLLTVTEKFGEWQICVDESILLEVHSRLAGGKLVAQTHYSEVIFYGLTVTRCFALTGQELACLPDWLAVSPAELTDEGLTGEKGTLEIRPVSLPNAEESFILSGKGKCTLRVNGDIVYRFNWGQEGTVLRRISRQNCCAWYAEEQLIWTCKADEEDVLQIYGATLHGYEFAELH